jgi:hypothetical protein
VGASSPKAEVTEGGLKREFPCKEPSTLREGGGSPVGSGWIRTHDLFLQSGGLECRPHHYATCKIGSPKRRAESKPRAACEASSRARTHTHTRSLYLREIVVVVICSGTPEEYQEEEEEQEVEQEEDCKIWSYYSSISLNSQVVSIDHMSHPQLVHS